MTNQDSIQTAADQNRESYSDDDKARRMIKEDRELIIRVDTVSDVLLYVGKAIPGTATSVALWRIQEITVVGDETIILWADGNTDFDNEWDDRASLSYS